MKKIWIGFILIVVIFGGGGLARGFLFGGDSESQSGDVVLPQRDSDFDHEPVIVPPSNLDFFESVDTSLETLVTGLEVPWDLDWTSEGRMLVTERPGRVRVVQDGVLVEESLHVFSEVVSGSSAESGLMGFAVDPNYDQNHFLYFCLAYSVGNELQDKVIRMVDHGDRLEEDLILLDGIPAAQYHDGCQLEFGPDQKLYITTGDALQRERAQDLKYLGGKILRLNRDGSIPDDNPFPESPVWTFGHRNPQGITWNINSDRMYETEHGPSGFDGPGGGDEVNRIVSGSNYGWPLVSHEEHLDGAIDPLAVFTPAEAPGSAAFYDEDVIPQFNNCLFFGALKGEGLVCVHLSRLDPDQVIEIRKLDEVQFGRIRAVKVGPDGFLYFSTSNRDGRGNPAGEDDRIFRIRSQM
ncbi:MAG: PQQ-dependent sugar dehydrogenase [bacterium]|nr:PQQ-dependent sugar dehydrogenase [bacterium]